MFQGLPAPDTNKGFCGKGPFPNDERPVNQTLCYLNGCKHTDKDNEQHKEEFNSSNWNDRTDLVRTNNFKQVTQGLLPCKKAGELVTPFRG